MERIKKYEPLWKKWRVTRKLGEGGFGAVYEVECDKFDSKPCAVKIISSKNEDIYKRMPMGVTLSSDEFEKQKEKEVKRKEKELELMNRLQGEENIVTIYDGDVYEHEDGIDVIIRMELLENLASYIQKKQISSDEEWRKLVIKIGIDICKALEICEQERIVHRDIKPENIFVNKKGRFKLGDFGISRELSGTASRSLKRQAGTELYMSPEAFDALSKVDIRTDIYSLGITMYQCLNDGMPPFWEDGDYDARENAIRTRLSGTAIPIPKKDNGQLWKIVQKACQFDKEDRYQHALEMRRDLEKLNLNIELTIEENKIEKDEEKIEILEKQKIFTGIFILMGISSMILLWTPDYRVFCSGVVAKKVEYITFFGAAICIIIAACMYIKSSKRLAMQIFFLIMAIFMGIMSDTNLENVIFKNLQVPINVISEKFKKSMKEGEEKAVKKTKLGEYYYKNKYGDFYTVPDKLGENFTSGIFKLDGKYYQVPFPLQEALNNGLELYQYEEKVNNIGDVILKENESMQIWLRNPKADNISEIEIEVNNPTNKKQVISSCIVTEVHIENDNRMPKDMYMPIIQKIPFDKKKLELLVKKYPDLKYRKSLGMDSYTFNSGGKIERTIKINWDTDQNLFSEIYISCDK